MAKLEKKIIIKGRITTETGMLVGGTSSAMNIGGTDKIVVRNPLNNQPYIPGSSLKGKMRSLLELSYGYVVSNGNTNPKRLTFEGSEDNEKHVTALLFGTAKGDATQRPSRIIVRDGNLINVEELVKANLDLPFSEVKTEVVIDRVTAVASPRTFERVPAGADFNLNLVLNIFEGDAFDENELVNNTFKSLQLVQDDYIGGSGSRGYGQVKFEVNEVIIRSSAYYQGSAEEDTKTQRNELTKFGVPNDLLAPEAPTEENKNAE